MGLGEQEQGLWMGREWGLHVQMGVVGGGVYMYRWAW